MYSLLDFTSSNLHALPFAIQREISLFLDADSYLAFIGSCSDIRKLGDDQTLSSNHARDVAYILGLVFDHKRNVFITGGAGTGKCLAPDTPILMWDGSVKQAREVKVGDQLIGDNSTPRKVLSICSGTDEMYQVSQNRGDSYTVNAPHILTLKISGHKGWYWSEARGLYVCAYFDRETFKRKQCKFSVCKGVSSNGMGFKTKDDALRAMQTKLSTISDDDVIDISVLDYLALRSSERKMLKGFKVGVDWPSRPVFIDPYVLGAWLGDGGSAGNSFTNIDQPILDAFQTYVESIGCKWICLADHGGNAIDYGIRDPIPYKTNSWMRELRNYALVNNKHIPREFLLNNRATRLELLAGLLDTDGHLDILGNCYDITQKNERLAREIQYLSRSLGFFCSLSQEDNACVKPDGSRVWGKYWRSCISGDGLEKIPCKLIRKRASPRKQKKNTLSTAIVVKHIGQGDYCGFTLDGNGRFLLNDFTATHNTYILNHIYDWSLRMGVSTVMTATTGIASINLKEGRTLHSFSGLRKGTIPIDTLKEDLEAGEFRIPKLWREVELLTCDEISMNGARFLSKLNMVGQYARNSNLPLGGLQVVFSGDYCQLPPVADKFAFTSPIWTDLNLVPVGLKFPFRQSQDMKYYRFLQRIRMGEPSEDDIDFLQERYKYTLDHLEEIEAMDIKPTRLMSKQVDVQRINTREFAKLSTPIEHTLAAQDQVVERFIEGKKAFYRPSGEMSLSVARIALRGKAEHQAPESLQFRDGAQYIMTFNFDLKKRHINGSKCVYRDGGSVEFIDGSIMNLVKCLHTFYYPVGGNLFLCRRQVALRLGYCSTYHSSQGCTLDSAMLDLGPSVFCSAQAYIGLSRIRAAEGLFISNFTRKSIKTHKEAVKFSKELDIEIAKLRI